jgi:ion channel-forming bestrophin family protein
MIVRDYLPWLRLWPQISRRLGLLFILDSTIAAGYVFGGLTFLAVPSLPLGTIGSALSIFLAFRTGSAYDRWWEARMLWGSLVNNSRTFARQVMTLMHDGDADERRVLQRRLVVLMICYVHALRCHLRTQRPFAELRQWLEPALIEDLRRHANVPSALLTHMAELVRDAYDRGWLDSFRWTAIDRTIGELTNVQGACERIKNTPMPKQYDYFPRVLVGFFCVLLPFGLVQGLGLLTPVASTGLGLIFITLDRIGREIEAPFETTVQDTPMTNLSRTIEINLRQLLGERAPKELHPVAGFVY